MTLHSGMRARIRTAVSTPSKAFILRSLINRSGFMVVAVVIANSPLYTAGESNPLSVQNQGEGVSDDLFVVNYQYAH
jgi:hypothetical protein